jgi:hypothetical protein
LILARLLIFNIGFLAIIQIAGKKKRKKKAAVGNPNQCFLGQFHDVAKSGIESQKDLTNLGCKLNKILYLKRNMQASIFLALHNLKS